MLEITLYQEKLKNAEIPMEYRAIRFFFNVVSLSEQLLEMTVVIGKDAHRGGGQEGIGFGGRPHPKEWSPLRPNLGRRCC